MRVRSHIATSAALSAIIYCIFRSVPMALGAFLAGVLIDLDHVLEGYLNFGRKFNMWTTIDVCESGKLKKAHLFLHSYEILLIYAFLVWQLNLGIAWYGIALGAAFHLILDAIFNPYYDNALFFIVRYNRRFEYSKIIDVKALLAQHRSLKRK